MDYKYIEQLMERYWQCETSLEEEQILRTFFSQESVPVYLLPYKDLFTYEHNEVAEQRLDEDFDRKMLEMVGETAPVKARIIHITERLKPLFRAAAVVAILLTLGNATQAVFQPQEQPIATGPTYTNEGISVAKADTVKQDSAKVINMAETPIIK